MSQPLPLGDLAGWWIGPYQIQIELKPLRHRQGWTHFSLYLKDREGRLTSQGSSEGGHVTMPVLEGIHSRGGRWVKGWIEIGDYFPTVHFSNPRLPLHSVNLADEGIDRQIFQILSKTVPPGGHLMFAYEVSYKSPFHRETQTSLMRGIPPICTAQGRLLFQSGFRLVRDWYLAEGGHEGPRKLWGEKPSNDSESRGFDLRTFLQLVAFLSKEPIQDVVALELSARKNASEVLGKLSLGSTLSALRDGLIHAYGDCFRTGDLEGAAHDSCEQVERFLRTIHSEDESIEQEMREIFEKCSRRSGEGLSAESG